MTKFLRNVTAVAAMLTTVGAAHAVLVGTNGTLTTVSGLRNTNVSAAPSGDALDAKTEWAKFVAVTGTEAFSTFGTGDPPSAGPSAAMLSLPSIGASLSCSQAPGDDTFPRSCEVRDTNSGSGRYDTTGGPIRYLQSRINFDGDIVLDFGSTGVAAFAFYMTDANDFLASGGDEASSSSNKAIELTDTLGNTTSLTVVTGDARENGNLQFFGFYNSGSTRYTSIRFLNTNTADGFGIDDLMVGRFTGDLNPGGPTIPEPGTLALIGAALAGIGLRKRRQRV